MMKIPTIPLYAVASRPLDVETLRAKYTASRTRAASASSRWSSARGAFRADVLGAVKASQDNWAVRQITQWLGEGSKHLPRECVAPQMPSTVTRMGFVGLTASALTYGAGQVLPWAGLTAVGLAAEASAILGLTARYAMAGVSAVAAGVFGLLHGVRRLLMWDGRVTTLHAPSDTVAMMQPVYDDFFGVSDNKSWPPTWQKLAGLDVHHQFVQDCTRAPHTNVSQTLEGQAPGLSVELTERVSNDEPSDDSEASRQQIAVNKFRTVCERDDAWASHLSCVLNQSLGNAAITALSVQPMLLQGGKPAFACSPDKERHEVARRDDETVVVSGVYDWRKGFDLVGANGRLFEHGASTAMWYKYQIAVKRPATLDTPLSATLEKAQWGLGAQRPV